MGEILMLDLAREYEYMKGEIDEAIAKCLRHQRWILGPEVEELEKAVAGYLDVRHCIGVSSGTEALVLSLRALAIKTKNAEYFNSGDEIITTPFTFTATGDAILRAGATPVFVDIDPMTFNISPEKAAGAVTEKTVGILPVHLYGQACDMDAIGSIARQHGLFVLEDVAQGFGGAWKGRKLGAIGTAGAFSFFPSKNLGCFGDGGMVSTGDDDIAELVHMLLRHGGRDKYNVEHIGYNARLDTIQAAVLLARMKFIDEFNSRRRALAQAYSDGLRGVTTVRTPAVYSGSHHVYHQYTLRCHERDRLQAFLKGRGVASMVYYPYPLHKMKVFDGRCAIPGNLAESEAAASEVLSIPTEPLLSDRDVQRVIEAVAAF